MTSKTHLRRLVLLVAGLALVVLAGPPAGSQPPRSVALRPPRAQSGAATAGQHAQAIILFIGDGMGVGQRTAGRWSAVGQAGALHMDELPWAGLSQTHSANSAITDSAAGGTALATGVKTNNLMVAVDPTSAPLTTILERAHARGMATGLVSTAEMTDATPACFAAHVITREFHTEIARQILAQQVDVLLGGGEHDFMPKLVPGCHPGDGVRTDGRNLVTEAAAAGYTYVCNGATFLAVDPATTSRLLGLFADGNMVRPYSPTLAEMTAKAIDILSRDPDGFFLMVEGAQIDKAAHINDAPNTISDTIGLDEAVAVAQAYAATASDTLIIVAADHETGGMWVALSPDGLCSRGIPFPMPGAAQFCLDWTTTGHTAADVPVTAQGPGAQVLQGTYENTYVHEVMRLAMEATARVYLPLVVR